MLRISYGPSRKVTTKKEAGSAYTNKKIRRRQLAFLWHVLRRHGLENLLVTGRKNWKTTTGRQRLKDLDSLCASWKDNVSPTQLIGASGDRVLWHRMVANVVNDGAAPKTEQQQQRTFVVLELKVGASPDQQSHCVDVVAASCPQHRRVVLVVAGVDVDAVLQEQFDEFRVAVQRCQVDAGQMAWTLTFELRQHGRFEELRASRRTSHLIQKHLGQLAVALLCQYV